MSDEKDEMKCAYFENRVHHWEIMSPEEIHERYGHMLSSEELAEIEEDIQGWE